MHRDFFFFFGYVPRRNLINYFERKPLLSYAFGSFVISPEFEFGFFCCCIISSVKTHIVGSRVYSRSDI